jgi:hypothetical protein
MRIIYIPGVGEKPNIFDHIAPHIAASETLILDNWELLEDIPVKALDALSYASTLVKKYHITRDDVIIGHSMGGRVALYIKHLVNCPIVQIASWTDPAKIIWPISNLKLINFLVKTGLFLNRFVLQYFVAREYKAKPSANIFIETFQRLKNAKKVDVMKQLIVILRPVNAELEVTPDLRIHARADSIVKVPSEPFAEVPGDHFALYTHPQPVYLPILKWLSEEEYRLL